MNSTSNQTEGDSKIVFESNPFYGICFRSSTGKILPERTLITIDSSVSVLVAVELLHKNRILAAPVFSENTCVGNIDVLSVFRYLFKDSSSYEEYRSQVPDLASLWERLAFITVKDVISDPHCSVISPFFIENPVSMLLTTLATGTHRVALFKKDKELISTCSQSDLIAFLAAVIARALPPKSPPPHNALPDPSVAASMAPMSDAELETIRVAMKTPARSLDMFSVAESLHEDVSMLEAIYRLATNQRRALAVTDASGAMRCQVSVTDLHLLTQASFQDLRLGVWEWLSRHSRKAMQPACVRIDASLGGVIALLALKRHHRLWVLDDAGVPTHVVSATDVLRALSSSSDDAAIDHRANSGDTVVRSLWRQGEDVTEDMAKKFTF